MGNRIGSAWRTDYDLRRGQKGRYMARWEKDGVQYAGRPRRTIERAQRDIPDESVKSGRVEEIG